MLLNMAFRFALVQFNNKEGSFLLRQTRTVVKPLMRSQPKSTLRPGAGFFEKPKSLLFAPENIMKRKDSLLIIYNLLHHLSDTVAESSAKPLTSSLSSVIFIRMYHMLCYISILCIVNAYGEEQMYLYLSGLSVENSYKLNFSLLLHEITLIIIAKRTLLCLAIFNVDFLLMIKTCPWVALTNVLYNTQEIVLKYCNAFYSGKEKN
uniref:Uncharacterized protein n=1 Tax=Glossina pallidipes TaxID=7398 RepID=A0A1A9ZAB8_GLOPL